MGAKQRFLDCVRHGSESPYVSLQIGTGAGFDCKLAGKQWCSEGTVEDTIRAYEIVGCDPLINLPLPDLGQVVPSLRWQSRCEFDGQRRLTHLTLPTPYGDIRWELMEQPKHGVTPVVYPITCDSDHFFDIVKWYAEQYGRAVDYVGDLVKPLADQCAVAGAMSIQWNIQPFELLGLASVQDMAMQALLYPDQYRLVCDSIRAVNIALCEKVFQAGADFVFLGGPGAEMISPQLYEQFLVPDSMAITQAIHRVGGLVYSHICSPIEPFLTKGYYNQMGIDLFETLSPPPVGNIADLARARGICDPGMCTRGNIGLDILLNGTPDEIEQATIEVINATRGSKHMIGASDYLFYDIPLANVQAVVRTASAYHQYVH